MTWYLWLILFSVLCLWPFSVLVAVVIGGKLARGETIQLKKTPAPQPRYLDAAQANKIIADSKREQDEQSANYGRT